MEKKFDPRGKERKRTNRKKWYKAVCSLAAAVVVCTVYTLMLPALTLDEESAGDAGVTISESSVPTSEAPAAESSKSDNGSESHNDTAADSSHAATESGPAAAAPSDDRAPSTTNPTTEGEHNAPVTLPTEETNSGAITGSSESHDEVTSPDTDDQEKIKDEENNGSPAADKEETDEEEADNSGSSTDADTEEDDSEKSDDTADVEDASYWETTIPDLSDCETWAEKLLAVAGSQLGYHESILNFRVDNKGEHKGYTRYGEWYGNPYGDWCAMFVSFCLKYAGIDEEAIPQNANCSDWVTNLKKMEIYEDADLYVPEAGDIVFFDQSDADRPNHVGIISEVTYGTKTVIRHITKDGSAIESGAMNALKYINEATSDDASGDELRTEEVEVPVAESIKVIEGNSSDQVQYVDYDLSNEKILGYISLTNAKNVYEGVEEQKPVEEQEIEPLKYEGSDYVIKVEYTEEAQLPEGVHLEAEELQEGTEAYEDYYNRTVEKLMDESTAENEDDLGISFARFFDLKFITTEGEEIEPVAPVSVKIRYTDRVEVNDDQTATVVHFAKTTATAETDDSWTSNSDISTFSMNAPAAIAVDSSNAQQSPAEANPAEGTSEIVEVPEIIEPEAVTNSTFEFEQGSFSVTATIIKDADNSKLENGRQYIIYTDNKQALSHANNRLSVETLEDSPENGKDYADNKFSSDIMWTYMDGAFYYKTYDNNGDDVNHYLGISGKMKKTPSILSEKQELTISSNKLSYNNYYYYAIKNNNISIEKNNNATKFNFAKIDEKYIEAGSVEDITSLTHEKYVYYNADKKDYDLTLTVSGAKGTEKNPAKLDVVFVLDVSGSMAYKLDENSSGNRLKAANNAIRNMVQSLSSNKNLSVKYSLVTFSGNDETKSDDAHIISDWGSKANLINSLPTVAEGGTNYEAGLIEAQKLLDNTRNGAQKAVIFVSDGDPTFYYNEYEWHGKKYRITEGYGSEYDPIALEHAQDKIKNMKMNYFFTIGVGPSDNYSKLKNLLGENVLPTGVNAGIDPGKDYENWAFAGTDKTKLESAFNTIKASLTNIMCENVTVVDTLSDYAELVDVTAVPVIEVIENSNGKVVKRSETGSGSLMFQNHKISAVYTDSEKKITLDFDDSYKLDPNYTFTVTVKIKPTQKALDEYIIGGANDLAYPNNGEEVTDRDLENNNTSTNKPGFRSNNDATVTYYYSNNLSDKKTEHYKHPVIQVDYVGYELPETGGPGTTLLYLLGAMLITAPLTITFIKRRRQENEEN